MNGIVNILKPPGMTSSNVISDIRRICQMKRVGHTGTLDPGACGVLPICLGKATKLFDYLMEKQKEYYCEICFGKSSDTLDAYGSLTASDNKIISKKEFEAILAEFKGEQTQIPPAYSALKVQGQKMYELARKGIEIQREKKQRIIQIYEIELLEQTQENRFLFRVLCSKGTYIRVLCEDIATKLHTCAYMSFLLRTRTGGYSIDQALTIDEVAKLKENGKLDQFLVPAEEILPDLPKFILDDQYFEKLKNGNAIPIENLCEENIKVDSLYRVYCQNTFFGLGKMQEDTIKIICMLYENEEN